MIADHMDREEGIFLAPADLDRRRALCAAQVTLDGAPAVIGGAASRFAGLRRLDGTGGLVEYSWETAERVVARGGGFRS